MQRIKMPSCIVESVAYDVLYQILKIEYRGTGIIYHYEGVPEEIWYQLRQNYPPEVYIQQCIIGKYKEQNLSL